MTRVFPICGTCRRQGTGRTKFERQADPEVKILKKALIVDDDPHISELLRLYFDKDGFEVVTCYDGNQAVEIFPQVQPDIVVLDLMLPGKDGYDVLRDIRRTSTVPVIMLTARGDTLDKVVGLELGADDYVQKLSSQGTAGSGQAILRRVETSAETYPAAANHPPANG
jgi:DNA-binding response OmpR family regulator